VRGWNAIEPIGSNAGMVLSALNEPTTNVLSLLNNPRSWEGRLRSLTGEAAVAAEYFLNEYPKSRIEQDKSATFKPKITQFTHSPVNKAIFSAPKATIDWEEVIENKSIVLLDFRGD